jgi:hypothetical protein
LNAEAIDVVAMRIERIIRNDDLGNLLSSEHEKPHGEKPMTREVVGRFQMSREVQNNKIYNHD